ncbi:MAG: hypothetical protein IPO67_26620 [Deltaproteobacteria bacterium]|nr:hypothetical protein [Deltaproteobacteria bacterium]
MTPADHTLHALQEQAQALGAEAPALQAVEHGQGGQAGVGRGQGLVLGAELGDVVPGEA